MEVKGLNLQWSPEVLDALIPTVIRSDQQSEVQLIHRYGEHLKAELDCISSLREDDRKRVCMTRLPYGMRDLYGIRNEETTDLTGGELSQRRG